MEPPARRYGPTGCTRRISGRYRSAIASIEPSGVDVISLDGTHESFVEEPALGEQLRAVIDRLEAHSTIPHVLPVAASAAIPANARNAT